MNKLFLHIIPFLFLASACQQDSSGFIQKEKTIIPNAQIDTVSSQLLTILIFKKEKKIELWEKRERNKSVFIEKGNYLNGFNLPYGHFQSKSGKMELNLPGDFYESKIKPYSTTYFKEFDLSKRVFPLYKLISPSKTSIFDQFSTTHQLNEVLILPNDLRKDGKFIPCVACPHWMAEVYGDLAQRLENYKVERN